MVTTPIAAALAGVPSGVQAQGPWAGRRQLFVRFAGEAETATMYTSQALAGELKKLCGRSVYHSISLGGRDALGNVEFLAAALEQWTPTIPVMLDVDGQRPEALPKLKDRVGLTQVTHDFATAGSSVERVMESLRMASSLKSTHALVLVPRDETTDGNLLRVIEQAKAASDGTIIVVHPPSGDGATLDRRWGVLLEQASRLHPDVRLAARIPPPVGMR